jgi:hypothetical protein
VNESSRRRPRLTLESLALELNVSFSFADEAESMLEDRITAIEEIIAARWWQRPALRRRLAAELRASARRGAHAADSFRGRRVEAVGDELIEQDLRRRGEPR